MNRLFPLLCLSAALLAGSAGAQSPYWQRIAAPTRESLLSVSFGSSEAGYMAGTNGTLLRTLDGGRSWTTLSHSGIQLDSNTPDLIHVNFLTAGTGFVVAGNRAAPVYKGTIYKTTDSGASWTALNPGNIAVSRSFFFDAQNGFVIGSAFFSGLNVVRQTAGSWGAGTQFSFDPRQFLYGIDFRSTAVGIVGGDAGYVYRTRNGGATWDTVKTSTDSMINTLRFLSDRTIIAGSDEDGGAVLISHDTGSTWQTDPYTLTFSYPDIKEIAASPLDSFIAVGHASPGSGGIILWHGGNVANNQITGERLNAVAMADASVAVIAGDSGAIYTNRQSVLRVAASSDPGVHIYPNPATRSCVTESDRAHSLRILDAGGRAVLQDARAAIRHHLDLRSFVPGIYIVELAFADGFLKTQRLVIE